MSKLSMWLIFLMAWMAGATRATEPVLTVDPVDNPLVIYGKLDGQVWEKLAPIQARRVKRVLGLGDDVQALAAVLKFTAPQWAPAGFDWELEEVGERSLRMTVHSCPMGTYRKERNLELLPCKLGAPALYSALAKVVNEKFATTCLHAHPDPPREGVMCAWEFVLED